MVINKEFGQEEHWFLREGTFDEPEVEVLDAELIYDEPQNTKLKELVGEANKELMNRFKKEPWR